jgi:hypothetical protein
MGKLGLPKQSIQKIINQMKNLKTLIFAMVMLTCITKSYSQWIVKTVDNKLDNPYKIAYCMTSDKKALLKLEKVGDELYFYLTGSYFCDESLQTDIALIVNGESKRYTFTCTKSADNNTVFILDDITSILNDDFLTDFKRCSSAIVRVNETHCTTEVYKFTMSGSTNAINVMSKQ